MDVHFNKEGIDVIGSFVKGDRPYAAKLTGLHPKFGFQRQFIGKKTKTGKTEGDFRIVIQHDDLKPGEVFELRCGDDKRYYHFISDLIIQGIDKNEAWHLLKSGKTTQHPTSPDPTPPAPEPRESVVAGSPEFTTPYYKMPVTEIKPLADYTDKEIIQECIRRNLR